MTSPRIAELKREWAEVCNAMNRGTWRGTEAEALADVLAEVQADAGCISWPCNL